MAIKTTIVIENNIPEAMKKIRKAEMAKMKQATAFVRGKVVTMLSGNRHGKRYKVPGTKNEYYIASAPGEPPARPTGELAGDVTDEVAATITGVEGAVGNTKRQGDKSISLELGRRNMAPRPYLFPAFALTKGIVKKILGGKWF